MPEQPIIVQSISSSEDFITNLNGYAEKPQKIALLLDFDGTLAPIHAEPELTIMPKETESVLKRLALNPNVFLAIISGRGIGDVRAKVGIPNITYAGNHGLEIEHADGSRWIYPLPQEVKDNHQKILKELEEVSINDAWTEDKVFSICYHYREIPEFTEEQKLKAFEIITKHGFRASQAHFAVDGKPPVNWNKGEAALKILKTNFGENWKNQVHVIFAGDDVTDEDAMKALKGTGKTFKVSTDPEIKTFADYRLSSPDEVCLLLKWLETQIGQK